MALDRLLGTWDLTMHHRALAEPVTGRQRYERVLDDAFVQLTWTYDHPDFPDALALITETAMHYFDVRGVVRVFDVAFTEDGWTMVRHDPELSQRFTARYVGADTIETAGEYSEDQGATWQHDFTMTLRRVG